MLSEKTDILDLMTDDMNRELIALNKSLKYVQEELVKYLRTREGEKRKTESSWGAYSQVHDPGHSCRIHVKCSTTQVAGLKSVRSVAKLVKYQRYVVKVANCWSFHKPFYYYYYRLRG